jgi:T5SS/PEP-CTERM-associated repeat protein
MKRNYFSISLLAICAVVLPHETRAQFTANNQTNVISGVVSNWPGDYDVGSNYVLDALFIQNGGVLSVTNGSGNIGGTSNSAVVSGNGSVWTNSGSLNVGGVEGNSLLINNGGRVLCSGGSIAGSNSVTVSGNGSIWSSQSLMVVGSSGSGSSLVISNGGMCICPAGGDVGRFGSANYSSALITGNGSIWTNVGTITIGHGTFSNNLVIRNGGTMVGTAINMGASSLFGNNTVFLTDTGSVLNLRDPGGDPTQEQLTVGAGTPFNTLVISNGAAAIDSYGYVGYGYRSNSAIVTGIGSLWSNRSTLYVGRLGGNGNSLIIEDGGTVLATNVYAGFTSGSESNQITISGGNLFATNSAGDAVCDIRRGTLTFNSGTITADNFLLTNGSASVIAFNNGALNTKGTAVANTQQFTVGDGVGIGNLHLLGGIHSFTDGLRIRANSLLTGCGTVNGSILVDAGAVARSDCSTLTFTGNVTNNGTMLADAAVLESAGTLVNNGTIYLFNGGTTNFHGTFINNGSIVNVGPPTISSISHVGNDIVLKLTSVLGLTYQLQSSLALPSGWSDSGASQTGTGSALTFTDPGAATNESSLFYRVRAY